MPSFIQNPFALGVRTAIDDSLGGPLSTEIIAGAGINITEVDVGGGNKKLRITNTGGGADTYTSSNNPSVNNDSVDTAGAGRAFEIGNYWINITTNDVFVCTDDTATAAIWELVDTTAYDQITITDDTTTDLILGDKDDNEAFFINYYMIAPGINRVRSGIIYVSHNGTVAGLRDEYTEVNNSLDVTPSVAISGSNVVLTFTAGTIGVDLKFRYTIKQINTIE